MIVRVRVAALALGVLAATPLLAQRAELAVIGGIVRSPDEEFDRVTSSQLPPPTYTRQRGSRESGSAFGVAATFAIRGHWFGEIGFLHHGVERTVSTTGTGDPTGPFLVTNTTEGTLTSIWMGPAFRVVDRERLAVSALIAPTVFVMQGDAYSQNVMAQNAPSKSTQFGFLAGLRARYWASERIGIQVSIEDAIWTFPIMPHPTEGSSLTPDAYRKTPTQHDIRVQLGAALRLR